jgi:hypothetical protein
MMGTDERPTQVESMILPPVAHDVKVISIAEPRLVAFARSSPLR